MAYQFGWFPRLKYRDLVFYAKADQGMNVSLFDLPDTEENRAIMVALIGSADELAALREEGAQLRGALEAIRIKLRAASQLMHYQINANRALDERVARELVNNALFLASARPAIEEVETIVREHTEGLSE